MKRKILVIAGASGVGKTTVAAHLLSTCTDFGLVRSITTRAPRGDGHDAEYIYLDRAEFLRRAESGETVEYMEYGGNMYGTPVSELDRIFGEGKIPLLILDIEGVKSLRSRSFDFTSTIVYVWDDINVIEKRLYARDLLESPTAEKLLSFIKRKEMNIRDYLGMPEISHLFDAFVQNDGIERCAAEIKELFDSDGTDISERQKENEKTAARLASMCKS